MEANDPNAQRRFLMNTSTTQYAIPAGYGGSLQYVTKASKSFSTSTSTEAGVATPSQDR
jgi:hypothetical protein